MTIMPTTTIKIMDSVKQHIKPLGGRIVSAFLFNINFTFIFGFSSG